MQDKPTDLEGAFRRLTELLDGNSDAVEVIRHLHLISHVWDDLIDRDREVAPASINSAFTAATIGLNLNPFFRQYAHLLVPVMLTGILNWHGANDLEASKRRLEVAYVTRCAAGDVALMCASIVLGVDRAATIAAELRLLMQQETLPEYLASHGAGEA